MKKAARQKEVKKAVRQKELEEARVREESAAQFVKELHAQKDIEVSNEETAMPRQKPKGQYLNLFIIRVIFNVFHSNSSPYQRISKGQCCQQWW